MKKRRKIFQKKDVKYSENFIPVIIKKRFLNYIISKFMIAITNILNLHNT